MYAIKEPGRVMWSGKYSPEQIEGLLQDGRLFETWMICPLGRADQAVTVREYLQNRNVFAELASSESQQKAAEHAIRESVPTPLARQWGGRLLRITAIYFVFARGTVTIFSLRDTGFTPLTLSILIPFWTIGTAGILLWAMGSVQHKSRMAVAVKRFRFDQDTSGVLPNR